MPVTGFDSPALFFNTPLIPPSCSLYFIPEINFASSTATVSLLLDRLSKSHHPVPVGKWAFEHRLYREVPLPPPTSPSVSHHQPPLAVQHSPAALKTLQILELSHHPKIFTLTGESFITIDREFEPLVRNKMVALWGIRQTLKGQGDCYDVDDFRVRIATVQQNQDVKGVIIEVSGFRHIMCIDGS